MNSPYGSFDHSSDWSWYDAGEPGWVGTPSTDRDCGFNNEEFSPYAGGLAPTINSLSWHPTPSGVVLTAPQTQQYDFNQGQQVWSVLDTYVKRLPQAVSFTNNRDQRNADRVYIPHNGATAALISPLDGLGITADTQCIYPRNTADHHSVAAEDLQVLFPSPTLPRKEPPCLYDNDCQPLQKQNPRFEGDLYTALWVRGEGVSRAGWCGFCASWHRLKDSAYWYHLHYTHGIACHSGRPLDPPRKLRWSRKTNVLEALCGTCEEWVAIGKGVKVRTTYWRHAYKCSTKGTVRSPRRAAAVTDH